MTAELLHHSLTTGCWRTVGYRRASNLPDYKSDFSGDGHYPTGYSLAEKIVLKKVKMALGLQECKFGFTGAAPITVETLEYFGALGIQINEVYGMSECTGATTWSTDECHLWGSCGYAMQGTEVAVFNPESKELVPFAADIFAPPEAEQGEICYRGRHIMMGYLANPALGPEHVAEIEKKTAGAIGAWASYCCPTPDAMLIPAAADAWVHIRCRWVAAFGR